MKYYPPNTLDLLLIVGVITLCSTPTVLLLFDQTPCGVSTGLVYTLRIKSVYVIRTFPYMQPTI